MSNKQRVVVICPGRGTYNKEELGYLARFHSDKTSHIEIIDHYRARQQQVPIKELDAMAKYNMRQHTAGEHASALIYGCALCDYLSIDQSKYEIVATTGNSMGWYIALATSGALNAESAIRLINTMGSMMTDQVIGGQLLYPIIDENWQIDQSRQTLLNQAINEVKQAEGAELYLSINLGGYQVIAGNEVGLSKLQNVLPMIDDKYPMRLFNHAAFHSPLMEGTSQKALAQLPTTLFSAPTVPLIDGLGNIWQPYNTDTAALHQYTLTTQVTQTYDFSKAIEVAVKEFAPDKLIILGPGATLGGAVAQSLIAQQWDGLACKADFIARQKSDPFILSMGIEQQRQQVVC